MAITSTTIDLTWTPATDNVAVTGYIIRITQPYDQVVATLGNVTSYTVSGLIPDTAYEFVHYAEDAAGNVSLVSNAVTGKTLT